MTIEAVDEEAEEFSEMRTFPDSTYFPMVRTEVPLQR